MGLGMIGIAIIGITAIYLLTEQVRLVLGVALVGRGFDDVFIVFPLVMSSAGIFAVAVTAIVLVSGLSYGLLSMVPSLIGIVVATLAAYFGAQAYGEEVAAAGPSLNTLITVISLVSALHIL